MAQVMGKGRRLYSRHHRPKESERSLLCYEEVSFIFSHLKFSNDMTEIENINDIQRSHHTYLLLIALLP